MNMNMVKILRWFVGLQVLKTISGWEIKEIVMIGLHICETIHFSILRVLNL
jgi:hypothetical protein